jgi:hypothetical protein
VNDIDDDDEPERIEPCINGRDTVGPEGYEACGMCPACLANEARR